MKDLHDAWREMDQNLRNWRTKQIDLVEYSRRNKEIEEFIIEYDRKKQKNKPQKDARYVDQMTRGEGLVRRWIPFWEQPSWLLKSSKEDMKRLLSKVFKKKKRVAGLHKNQIFISDDFDEPLYLAKEEELTKEALILRKNLFKDLEAEIKDMKNWKEDKK
jgi:hypothetical protein